jgi:hypothetical protein
MEDYDCLSLVGNGSGVEWEVLGGMGSGASTSFAWRTWNPQSQVDGCGTLALLAMATVD